MLATGSPIVAMPYINFKFALMDNHQVKEVKFVFHDIDTNFAQWASGVLPLLSPDVELVIGLAHLHILCSFAHIDYGQLKDIRTEQDIDLAKQLIDQTRQILIDLLELKGQGR
ncbi:MAG TPA: hypothetical protein VFS17_07935 [Methylophilaceae bacterium]|nr:hypothetical protein [Methylophilaceae bacterium]